MLFFVVPWNVGSLEAADTSALRTFVETYIYQAGEADSKLTCRAISLLEVKKLLLEKVGTYIESRTEVVDFQLTRDEITTLSAGVLKTEIVSEQWNGQEYILTARVEVDIKDMVKQFGRLQDDHEMTTRISDLKSMNDSALKRVETLKAEMASIQKSLIETNRNFQVSSRKLGAWNAYEDGLDAMFRHDYKSARSHFRVAVQDNPSAVNQYQLGRALLGLENYSSAIKAFGEAIRLNPQMHDAYFRRGKAYRKIGEKEKGLRDIRKANQLGNGKARRWLSARNRW